MRPSLMATSASNNSPPRPSAMLPPRITRSALVTALHPILMLLGPHHPLTLLSVNVERWGSGLQQPLLSSPGRFLRAAIGQECKQHGGDHEGGGDAEHPMRHVSIHDPAKQNRAQNAAEIEAGGDEAESASRGARGRGGAHQHISGRRDDPAEETRRRHRRDQQNRRDRKSTRLN